MVDTRYRPFSPGSFTSTATRPANSQTPVGYSNQLGAQTTSQQQPNALKIIRPPAQPGQLQPSQPGTPPQPQSYRPPAQPGAYTPQLQQTAAAPQTTPASTGLRAVNLGKSYDKRPIIRDVSLHVNRGEAVGLLGPNGAGKTTCFYMITGLIVPDYGSIFLDKQEITHLPVYRRAREGVGYLPQEASIFRGLTVEENIRAILEISEPLLEKRKIILEELLAEFSIDHLRNVSALALSGGERRRVEIARALASRPSFILLDEPLAGIDPIAVADIRSLVSHLKNRGIGVLITDHNVRETLGLVDRAYIIHSGTVLMEGKPHEIVGSQDVRKVYLGERFSL